MKRSQPTDFADTSANRFQLKAPAAGAQALFHEATLLAQNRAQAGRTGYPTARTCGDIAAACPQTVVPRLALSLPAAGSHRAALSVPHHRGAPGGCWRLPKLIEPVPVRRPELHPTKRSRQLPPPLAARDRRPATHPGRDLSSDPRRLARAVSRPSTATRIRSPTSCGVTDRELIADSSPLIALAVLDPLDLLPRLYRRGGAMPRVSAGP